MKLLLLTSLALTLSLAGLTGCGGGSSNTPPPPPPASITSFVASSSSITAGSSATLTGVFANGAGVITPGNLPATSGVAVTVSPTTTTSYTLTVTSTSGAAVTATASITVNPAAPAPSISSFSANDSSITEGTSATLTGVFANGTGVITPGNLAVTSGVGVSVSPAGTTTYILTVTGTTSPSATATAIVTVAAATVSSVTVDLSSSGPAVTDKLLGMNMAVWYDLVTNQTGIVQGLQAAGITQVRWPGGSDSDQYHWATNAQCNGGYSDPNDTFTNFVTDMAKPANLDVALTADYGSNAACTAGGDPSEAADWATAALNAGITPSHITVGNEEYGSWEYDLHSTKNDPTIYAAVVVGTTGYYQSIKTASPSTLVGVDVDADNATGGWDNIVMANAKGSYDFVEYHYYPETPGRRAIPSWCSRPRRS